MKTAPLLIEIGCEEIPARMVGGAAEDLRLRLLKILDGARLDHGPAVAWGGPRRLAVRVEAVASRQRDREELVVGPPADVAFGADGKPTPAALGFARKQGIEPSRLERVETEKGVYAGIKRGTAGEPVAEIVARALPPAVERMSFPKTMRWGDGRARWVRPVHWVLALHGRDLLPVGLFGIRAEARSAGHRFLSVGPVPVKHPDRYPSALRKAHVVIDPAERRAELGERLADAAGRLGGRLIEDPALLEETADMVEWPRVVEGRFDERYLELPREILVTTLRHHQRCFSVQGEDGQLLSAFLAVSNAERDPAGHIRRGNEWVVGGRLEDARFFWNEDRKAPLASRSASLEGVGFHAKAGSYAEKAVRIAKLAGEIAEIAGLDADPIEAAREAGRLAKNDLVTGTVGEFPELQGITGGLLLRAEGGSEEVSRAIYGHYKPMGSEDSIPGTPAGCALSVADKLDSIAQLIRIGEVPTGARDLFGLRRAANGIFRVVLEMEWPFSLNALWQLTGREDAAFTFLRERLENFLRERGYTSLEVRSVMLAEKGQAFPGWSLPDVGARLRAISMVREREDFRHLVELTKRVANIQRRNQKLAREAVRSGVKDYDDPEPAVKDIEQMLDRLNSEIESKSAESDYPAVVDLLAGLVEPVDRFFDKALVINPDDPTKTAHRLGVLARLSTVLTQYFDISELSGEAERRG